LDYPTSYFDINVSLRQVNHRLINTSLTPKLKTTIKNNQTEQSPQLEITIQRITIHINSTAKLARKENIQKFFNKAILI
jgi:hypothetical protein